MRNGTLASEHGLTIAPSTAHVVTGTGWPADASTSDVLVTMHVPPVAAGASAAVGVRVLANVSDGNRTPFGGILAVVNFTARAADGTMQALASIRTLDPCAVEGLSSGVSSGLSMATFPILAGETALEMRLLVDRSTVEVFVMGGRVVFSATYRPSVLYVPDTHIALHAWGSAAMNASVDVYSMGCGWTEAPYQPHPTML